MSSQMDLKLFRCEKKGHEETGKGPSVMCHQ